MGLLVAVLIRGPRCIVEHPFAEGGLLWTIGPTEEVTCDDAADR